MLVQHLREANRLGIVKPIISVFPPKPDGARGFRVWNTQLLSFAGYRQNDGSYVSTVMCGVTHVKHMSALIQCCCCCCCYFGLYMCWLEPARSMCDQTLQIMCIYTVASLRPLTGAHGLRKLIISCASQGAWRSNQRETH
jgi:hypothetical protein